MIVIEMNMNLLSIAGILLVTFLAGFLLRSGQIRLNKKKILELEKEMLSNHAQILELEKEKAILIRQMKESKIPVISLEAENENRRAK